MTHDFPESPAAQPSVLVAGFLLALSLHDECSWRAAPIRRQEVLRRLVVRNRTREVMVTNIDVPG